MIQAIGLTSLPRRHQLKPAVDDLTFEARPGRVTVLHGPGGSGKTTALRLMLQLQAGRGTALFRGRPVHRITNLAREVGVLFGEVNGHPGRTARGHLRMLAAAAGVPAGRADDVLDVVGLSGLADQRMGMLSRGMDRRLGMACALLGDPHTLILDEPANGLSPRETAWLYSLLRGYAHQGGAVLVTSHLSEEAAGLADRVVSVDSGRLIADQGVADFVRTRLRPRVAVRTPYAERLVAVLTQEGRKAGKDRDNGPLKVVREGGTRVSVYGSSCAEVGEYAHRNGILIHQLTDESGDTGDAHVPGPLERADGRGPSRSEAGPVPAAAASAQAHAGTEAADEAFAPTSPPGAPEPDSAGTPVEPEPTTDPVLLELEELTELEDPAADEDAAPDSRPGTVSSEQPPPHHGTDHRPRPEPGDDPGTEPEPVLISSPAAAPASATTSASGLTGPASMRAASGDETPPHGLDARPGTASEADPETIASEAPTVRLSESPLDGPPDAPSAELRTDSRTDPETEPSADAVTDSSEPGHSSSGTASIGPGIVLKPLADPDLRAKSTPVKSTSSEATSAKSSSRESASAWTPNRPPARAAAELPPQLHAVARPGPAAPLRYELCRLISIRSTWTAMVLTLVVALCVGLVMARTGAGLPAGSGGSLTPAVRLLAGWPAGGVFFLPPAALAAGLLGAFAFGEEFRYPALAPARSPVPRRLSLLAAKLAVSATLALLLSVAVAVVNAAGVTLLFGSEALSLPSDTTPVADGSWQLHIAAVFAFAVGCAWAGVLAAGVFRSGVVGTAVVVTVPLLLAPVVRTFLGGAPGPGRSAEGLPGRLEAALLVPWPPGTEDWVAAVLELASQPVGSALALSLTVLLAGYVVTVLNSKVR
ncbi:hypothetical protein AN219_38135 [Streptomyces nanshensis]|nr:hypothetical protein AN219_38135 [Streptomyces nanshensis]